MTFTNTNTHTHNSNTYSYGNAWNTIKTTTTRNDSMIIYIQSTQSCIRQKSKAKISCGFFSCFIYIYIQCVCVYMYILHIYIYYYIEIKYVNWWLQTISKFLYIIVYKYSLFSYTLFLYALIDTLLIYK